MSNSTIKNVFAVLAHDNSDCLIDLINNIQKFDPKSEILVYDSSKSKFLEENIKSSVNDVHFVKNCQPLQWGDLLEFPISCIETLGSRPYDTITFFDSDQLLIRSGYTEFLTNRLPDGFGILSSNPYLQGVDSNMMSVRDLHREWTLWESYMKGFSRYAKAFVRSTFWPGTVISRDAAQKVAREIRSPIVMDILKSSKAWATEECILPTISYLMGYDEYINPCNRDWCTFRNTWTENDLSEARNNLSAFYMHPVPRVIDNPLRVAIRNIF